VAVFVLRRLISSFVILLVATFLVFVLVSHSGDPYADLRGDHSPDLAQKLAHRTATLHLDESDPQRYARWFGGAARCVVPGMTCDLGRTIHDQEVAALLGQAMASTLRLVTAATVLAILLGIAVGIVSALRQYSGFDYAITFSAFLFFSLPVFWVAVLLKQYLAITVNNWYSDPRIGPVAAGVAASLSGLAWGAVLGGSGRRRWIIRGAAAAATFGLLTYLSAVHWFVRPALGPAMIVVSSFGISVAVTALVCGLHRRRVVYSCLITAGIGAVAQFLVTPWLQDLTWASWTNVLVLAVVSLMVAVVVGWAVGGEDRGTAVRANIFTALGIGSLIVVDEILRAVPAYSELVGGRLVATIGSQTPDFTGTFWPGVLDQLTHLVLPTLAIMLISFATYSRYSRAAMLETMNQDYVRTARAKGLTERTVVLRHAFRNALIPLTTVVAYDFGNLLGGAVITETVFARQGMGTLFVTGLSQADPNPVMAFFVVTAVSIVIVNLMADLAYAYLDPRIQLS
jgi:peptide/nickel transport system permease protein